MGEVNGHVEYLSHRHFEICLFNIYSRVEHNFYFRNSFPASAEMLWNGLRNTRTKFQNKQ